MCTSCYATVAWLRKRSLSHNLTEIILATRSFLIHQLILRYAQLALALNGGLGSEYAGSCGT